MRPLDAPQRTVMFDARITIWCDLARACCSFASKTSACTVVQCTTSWNESRSRCGCAHGRVLPRPQICGDSKGAAGSAIVAYGERLFGLRFVVAVLTQGCVRCGVGRECGATGEAQTMGAPATCSRARPDQIKAAIRSLLGARDRLAPAAAACERAVSETRPARLLRTGRGAWSAPYPDLELILSGCNNQEISNATQLSLGTVKNYVSAILLALDVRSRAHLDQPVSLVRQVLKRLSRRASRI